MQSGVSSYVIQGNLSVQLAKIVLGERGTGTSESSFDTTQYNIIPAVIIRKRVVPHQFTIRLTLRINLILHLDEFLVRHHRIVIASSEFASFLLGVHHLIQEYFDTIQTFYLDLISVQKLLPLYILPYFPQELI